VLVGQNVDHGESSRAGEQDAGESGYGAAKKGKRGKPNPLGLEQPVADWAKQAYYHPRW